MNATVIARRANFEHRFFLVSCIAVLLIVFVGVARTNVLRLLFDVPVLTPLVHLHGALMSAWFVLFLVQTYLIASHRVRWHRRLGVFGALLALAIVVIGPIVLVNATAREISKPDGSPFFYVIFGVDFAILLDFAILVGTAIALRHLSDVHKRLMFLATASIVLPALGRLPLGLVATWLLFYACVLVPVAVDTLRHRRLHPAFGWGAPLLLASQQLTYFATKTELWTHFVKQLLT